MPAPQTVTPQEELLVRIDRLSPAELSRVAAFIDSLDDEPNEETIAALREAEDLDSLTECADLQDMLVKCGVKC
jgi:hypothetical protein